MKLAYKFSALALAVVGICLPLLTLVISLVSHGILRDSVLNHQKALALNVMSRIDRSLFQALKDIRMIARDELTEEFLRAGGGRPGAAAPPRGLVKEYDERLLLTGPWMELRIVGRDGRMVFSTDRHESVAPLERAHPEDLPAFEAALRGESRVSDLHTASHSGIPTLTFAVPVRDDRTSAILGAVMGHYTWMAVQQMLDELQPPLQARLVNRTGSVIAAPAEARDGVLTRSLARQKGQGEESWDMASQDGRQGTLLMTAVPQTGWFDFPSHGWTLLLTIPTEVVFAPARRLVLYTILLSVVIGVVGIGAFFLLTRRTAAPLTIMTTNVRAIAAGDLNRSLAVTGSDEIGELATEINQMSQDLLRTTVSNEQFVRTAAELRAAQAQIVQSAKLAAIGELAAGVAHELNQPLMVIRGTAQLLERGLKKGTLSLQDLPDHLAGVIRGSTRMMNIINHLRTFARRSGAAFEPVRINKIIEYCFLLIGEQLKLRDIAVTLDLASGLPDVSGNPLELEQVMLNLITNARDAIDERRRATADGVGEKGEKEKGGLTITTRHVTVEGAGFVEILVRDNGCGMRDEVRERIFEPFFTTKEVGQGTGLGLSISYGIIKNHQGEIAVAASGPEGTTFRVRLPVAVAETGDKT